ncbi:copper/silver efflux system, membrane component [Candidatus Terasakiella magnetica]|uniref:Copper/silver efflux system, membrane component n=1 Tax=Candidatus Terasakiella magnetica TaxID=1867952 RepID=A0A1C3RHE3_9PROT|nr:efflux RND transporter permease subunit [Candidatus Terasakiella magnetica]SCA56695.1 copper/silver efflux system, membrane component [Candidatus Terasakiella magnetica]
MISNIIHWSINNRLIVILMTVLFVGWGSYSVMKTPLDAIPDLSDVQVIIKTSYPGQAPQVVEDQVTYPLTTAMLSVPGATNVRGYSFFGDSYVYIIFEDGTDLYWARSRVLEYLSQVAPNLPPEARAALGPDATGVGWVYQYALTDKSGKHDLSQLRSIQDWFLKYELQTVPGVSEVATIGGMVKQYQVIVDPDRLRAFGIPLSKVRMAIKNGNQEVGGSVIEMAEAEYMVRATGYIQSEEDLRSIPLGATSTGTPIVMGDIADIRVGPQLRRGIGELNGEGEAVGGVIIMRWGENALTTIEAAKAKIEELKKGLPEGVEIVETYDRSGLIERAVETLKEKLLEEFIVVALVCAIFLFHVRSALVIVASLPVGIIAAFVIMGQQGINANIMSLGGIAIAIGAMVDAAIVMIENVHKHMERIKITDENRWRVIADAASEVGAPLFFSLVIITLSFVPVFTLEAQEGRLFSPLAFTKTYAMGAAAILSITLVPVLMGYFIRGHVVHEHKNPVNRALIAMYRPFINVALRFPKTLIIVCLALAMTAVWPLKNLGSEFMPELDEGDLLYMPSAFPAISVGKVAEVVQQTNKLIRTIPEVETVYGKAGRADSATDPAPLTMIETTIKLKPKDQWREGMTIDGLKKELNQIVNVPSLTNTWIMPIKNRIDMLATGIKTPVGIKVAGPDLDVIAKVGEEIEKVVKNVPGTASVYAERVTGGRYVNVDIDRAAAARYGLNIKDVQDVVKTAIGGMTVTRTVEGRERYPVNLRYPRDVRDSVEQVKTLPIVTPNGAQIPLAEVANVKVVGGPGMIRSENARLNGWIYVDIADRDLGSYVVDAKKAVADQIKLPAGYSIAWSGQYEFMERAKQKLSVVVPVTIAIIVVLLFLNFKNLIEVGIIMGTLPFALVGGVWLLYLLGYNFSVAVGVGFIALAGVAVEIGVLMLVYLNQALDKCMDAIPDRRITYEDLNKSIIEGALMRVRPIMMTFSVVVAGLLPIMFGTGTGSEVMRRIAAPMVGGMISATALALLIIPAVFVIWKRAQMKKAEKKLKKLEAQEADS